MNLQHATESTTYILTYTKAENKLKVYNRKVKTLLLPLARQAIRATTWDKSYCKLTLKSHTKVSHKMHRHAWSNRHADNTLFRLVFLLFRFF